MRSPILIYVTWPWSEDHRYHYCPVQVSIHTRRKYTLIRPFSKSQSYDWERGCWTGVIDPAALRDHHHGIIDENHIVWKHISTSPEKPEIWEALGRRHKNA